MTNGMGVRGHECLWLRFQVEVERRRTTITVSRIIKLANRFVSGAAAGYIVASNHAGMRVPFLVSVISTA